MQYKILKPVKGMAIGEIFEQYENSTEIFQVEMQVLLDLGYIEEYDPNKKWEPKDGDEYWKIQDDGTLFNIIRWENDEMDNDWKNFLGVYPTQQEAEQARDKIKAFISNGFK